MRACKNYFSSVRFRNGAYTWLVTVIFIAIIVVVNLIYRQIPFNFRNMDINATGIYRLSDITKELAENLDKDIELIVVAENDAIDTRIKHFLEIYAAQSDRISVRYEDPVASPSVLRKYNTTADTIVVLCDDNQKTTVVSLADLILYDEYSYYYYGTYNETGFDADGQLTSAIQYVCNDMAQKIYMTEGHQESAFGDTVNDMLDKSNLTTENINIFKDGEIPADCEMMVSYAPVKDFAPEEIDLIRAYMNQGGNFMLIMKADADTPNLDALMEEFGLSRAEGNIADMRQAYRGNPYYLLPTINSSDVSSSLSRDAAVLIFNAAGLVQTEKTSDNVVITPILSTSAQGFAITEDSKTQGTYLLAAYAEKTPEDGEASTFTVFTTDTIINENLISGYSNISNAEIFLNALTKDFEGMTTISIEPVSLEVTYNTVKNQGFFGVMFVAVIPIAVLLFGFVKWMIRRKK